jgi:hypothetical protein
MKHNIYTYIKWNCKIRKWIMIEHSRKIKSKTIYLQEENTFLSEWISFLCNLFFFLTNV